MSAPCRGRQQDHHSDQGSRTYEHHAVILSHRDYPYTLAKSWSVAVSGRIVLHLSPSSADRPTRGVLMGELGNLMATDSGGRRGNGRRVLQRRERYRKLHEGGEVSEAEASRTHWERVVAKDSALRAQIRSGQRAFILVISPLLYLGVLLIVNLWTR
jgi:hypothetical protein